MFDKSKITIPNSIFDDFDVINDGAIKIYLTLKLKENIEEIKEFTKKQIQEYVKISEKILEKNIEDLINMGYVCRRREEKEYIYYINPYFSSITGFTMLSNVLIKTMKEELTDSEIKLYSYLYRIIGDNLKVCFANQICIASNIGKTQEELSLIMQSLIEKKYIELIIKKEKGVQYSSYILKY